MKKIEKQPQKALKQNFRKARHVVDSFTAKRKNNRTKSERVADFLTESLGSVPFLSLNLLWFVFWIGINTQIFPLLKTFDPFPFGLLTMMVSLEAIFLAIIVLISQNRSARIGELREEIDLQINTIAEEEITKIIELQVLTLKQHGINLSKDKKLQEMLQQTDTAKLEKELEEQVGEKSNN